MDRGAAVVQLADEIVRRGSRRVGIDGRSAAGKTTLAAGIAAELHARGVPVRTRPVDDFHHPREHRYRQGEYSPIGYYEDAFDHAAIVRHVMAAGDGVLLFEGIFLFRHELDPCWDFRILVDVDPTTSVERGVARDAGVIGAVDVVRHKYRVRYEPAWLLYEERAMPAAKADAVLINRDFASPRLTFRQMP